MSDGFGDAMMIVDDMEIELGRVDPENCELWLNKTYNYTSGGGGSVADSENLYIRSHVDMFAGSTGCFEWDAGYLLCEFIANNTSLFEQRTIVELGCGTGMVAIALSKLVGNAGRIICTDGDQETLNNCEDNLRINGVSDVQCHRFQWEDGIDGLAGVPAWEDRERPACMVGADLLYDPEIIPVMVPLIVEFLDQTENSSAVYLSTRRRSEETLQKFLDAVVEQPSICIEDISEAFWESSKSDPSFVSFLHIPSLEEARREQSIILHKITPRNT
jgi:predicted nicotinamide N-methyase